MPPDLSSTRHVHQERRAKASVEPDLIPSSTSKLLPWLVAQVTVPALSIKNLHQEEARNEYIRLRAVYDFVVGLDIQYRQQAKKLRGTQQ